VICETRAVSDWPGNASLAKYAICPTAIFVMPSSLISATTCNGDGFPTQKSTSRGPFPHSPSTALYQPSLMRSRYCDYEIARHQRFFLGVADAWASREYLRAPLDRVWPTSYSTSAGSGEFRSGASEIILTYDSNQRKKCNRRAEVRAAPMPWGSAILPKAWRTRAPHISLFICLLFW
jgi:hypothetical protein